MNARNPVMRIREFHEWLPERLRQCRGLLDAVAPVADLLLRLWVAKAFWDSGVTKIRSWDSTLYLFEYEYSVPLLPPEVAAYLATGIEISMPVLLALGLFGGYSALVLFVFNIIAVISYPDLAPSGREQHVVWGLMLLAGLAHGPGSMSVDHLLFRRRLRTARPNVQSIRE